MDSLWETIQSDFSQLDQEDKPFARYLSLTNRFNDGLCAGSELDVYRNAMNKAVNSLSDQASIVRTEPIDPDRLIYRIDTRHYGWDAPVVVKDGVVKGGTFSDKWEAIVEFSETAVRFQGDQARQVQQDALTDVPLLMADAFIASATVGNLYYALVNIPDTLNQLLLDLQVNRDLDRDLSRAPRAGTTASKASRQDRIVVRNVINAGGNRGLWQAFDSLAGSERDIFTNPIDIEFDNSVAMFNLNNGLFGYAIFDDAGNRLEESAILLDTNQNDFVARTAVSCGGCHAQGLFTVDDEVAQFVQENRFDFSNEDFESLLELYDSNAFERAIENDNRVFLGSLNATGVPINNPDPIQAVALLFDQDLDLITVAAELGLSTRDLLEVLPFLDRSLQELENGGTIARRDFTPQFLGNLCAVRFASTNRPDDIQCADAEAALDR